MYLNDENTSEKVRRRAQKEGMRYRAVFYFSGFYIRDFKRVYI